MISFAPSKHTPEGSVRSISLERYIIGPWQLLDAASSVDRCMRLTGFTSYESLRSGKENYSFNGEREMFYLTTHSTHFIYGYMASDIWLRTIPIVREEIRCRHIGYSYRLTARVLLYAPSHRQDNTYHGLCYTSCGALAGTRNSSMGPPHEWSIRRPIAPWANALTSLLIMPTKFT